MSGLVDIGAAILLQSERRVEVAAENVANMTTPAFKRRVAFSTYLENMDSAVIGLPQIAVALDDKPGKMQKTGKASDLAIGGEGFFLVRSGEASLLTRVGSFSVDGGGRLVNEDGMALQQDSGSDLIVSPGPFEVRPDGAVVQGAETIGKVGLFNPTNVNALRAVPGGYDANSVELSSVGDANIYQGMVEGSNVSLGNEMVMMMEALRRAESGQRVVSVYDELMGRAITSFGETVR